MSSRRRQAADRRRNKNQGAGSSPVGEPAFLSVGRLLRPHGLRGEILMAFMTDFPERIKPGVTLYLGFQHTPVTITNIRHHNKGAIVTFEGFDSLEDVNHWRNEDLFVKAEDRPPLPDGEYYLHQLIGMQAITDEGENLGIFTEMIETGANNVFVIRGDDGVDLLLPDIDEVILNIDLEKKQILVHLIEGLLP